MPVNTGSLGSTITFSDLQTFYGGSHPISLSEYYRGGAEVPSTALTGANPYTGTTSFSGSGTGSGGSSGISVSVANQDTTSGGGTLAVTQSITQGRYIYSWSGAGTLNFSVRVTSTGFGTVAWGSRVNGGGSQRPSVTNNLGGAVGNGRNSFNQSGYTHFRADAVGSGNSPNGAGRIDATFTYTGAVSGAGSVQIFSTGGGISPTLTNSSTAAAVTVSRRAFTFTNNTGQVINFSGTGNGTSANNSSLARGGTTTTGIVSGASEAWNFSYSYLDAGSGSGSSDATVAGIFANVTAQTVTTTNPNASVATLTGSGQSVSAVNIPAGDVDFTLSATPRSDDNLNVLFATGQIDRSGLTLTTNAPVPFRVGDGTPASGLGPGRSGYFDFNFSNRGVGNTFTLRVTGNIPSARTWAGFAGNIGGAPSHANGVISLVNNAQTSTSTVQDISFTNNTGSNVIFSSSSTGGARTLNNGATAQVQDNGASSNWSFAYRYAPSTQPANTAIPTSGTTSLNQFNSPGNASP